MERWEVINRLFDKKTIALLQLFFLESERKWYLTELAHEAHVPPATAMRILRRLVSSGILSVESFGHTKLYTASKDENFRFLEAFLQQERQLLSQFVKSAGKLPGVDTIILHGKATKARANILLIGDNIDSQKIKEICGEMMESHKFLISSLTLTREQFDQMTSMGLYSGEKRILWSNL